MPTIRLFRSVAAEVKHFTAQTRDTVPADTEKFYRFVIGGCKGLLMALHNGAVGIDSIWICSDLFGLPIASYAFEQNI